MRRHSRTTAAFKTETWKHLFMVYAVKAETWKHRRTAETWKHTQWIHHTNAETWKHTQWTHGFLAPVGYVSSHVQSCSGICGVRGCRESSESRLRGWGGAERHRVTAAEAPREFFNFLINRTHWVTYSHCSNLFICCAKPASCDSIKALWKTHPQAQLSQQAHN